VNVTVAKRGDVDGFAVTDSVAVPDDEEAGDTDNHASDETADHEETLVATVTDLEFAPDPGDQVVGETDSVAAPPACVTLTVAAGAEPPVNVTVAVRVEAVWFAVAVSVAAPDDEDAGETDSQESDVVADQDAWSVYTAKDVEPPPTGAAQLPGRTERVLLGAVAVNVNGSAVVQVRTMFRTPRK
jgi:hypothetical protein